ncbi:pirin protein [Leptodontidium sp. 2 PMI_412]|nr:pirin protein [Leptodontidium sp. 2 PMI_412]
MALVARTVLRHTVSAAKNHGSGMSIRQPIGPGGREFMPFLLLDDLEVSGDSPGFGDHPHSGQETISYILEGNLVHQDSKGSQGILRPGDLQYMKARRGIMHSEVPQSDPVTNRNRGIQLWVALPQANLNDEPKYQDILSQDIPAVQPAKGVTIKVISGESFGISAPIPTCAAVHYLDVLLQKGAKIQHPIPEGYNAFVHTLAGTGLVGGQKVGPHDTTFFTRRGDFVELENTGDEPTHLLLLSGEPLDGQEVFSMGPFISTTRGGLDKKVSDYRAGVDGFEGVHSWNSKKTFNFNLT